MASQIFMKDPDAVLDFSVDWSEWLATGETISASTWTADGVTVDSDTAGATSTTAWLSGGTAGTQATVTNRITTNQSRTDDRTLTIRVRER